MSNIRFLTVVEFKSEVQMDSADIIQNPNTSKLFLAGSNGKNYKVEQNIDSTKPMKFLVADDNLDDACLINIKPGTEPIFSI